MKTFLVIGLGRFGRHLSLELMQGGNEVMILDINEDIVSELAPNVTNAQIGDSTKPGVLESIGVNTFDICFVCIGSNFQSSLETTALLKDHGAARVISKASTAIQAKFLLRNGADEVIYPERDSAVKLAHRVSSSFVVKDFLELTPDISIYEIACAPAWIGKSLRQLDFRAKFSVNVLAVSSGDKHIVIPSADHVFSDGETLMVMGSYSEVQKLLKKAD